MSAAIAYADDTPAARTRTTAWTLRALAAVAQSRLAVLAAAALILIYRKPGVFRHPQFWAEDGTIFFRENIELGNRAFLHPYAGYLLLVPRAVAWLAGRLPSVYSPRIYRISALAILLYVVWQLAGERLPFRYKRLCALATVLVAHSGEVFLNMANVQWITGLLLIFLLIAKEPSTRRAAIVDFATLVLAGFTGPFLVLFAPLFVVRFGLGGRSRYNAALLAAALLVAAAHACFMLFAAHGNDSSSGEAPRTYVLAELVFKTIFASGSGALFFGDYMSAGGPSRPVVVAVSICACLLILSQSDARRWRLAALLLVVGALISAAAIFKARTSASALWCIANAPVAGDRYRYLPRMMVLWGLLLALECNGWRRVAAAMLLGLCAFGSANFFCAPLEVDYHWRQYAARIDRGESVDVPIPPSRTIHFRGKNRQKSD
jgi:hypothetical protein